MLTWGGLLRRNGIMVMWVAWVEGWFCKTYLAVIEDGPTFYKIFLGAAFYWKKKNLERLYVKPQQIFLS